MKKIKQFFTVMLLMILAYGVVNAIISFTYALAVGVIASAVVILALLWWKVLK